MEKAKEILLLNSGISKLWLDAHFYEICEENDDYFKADCDDYGHEYIWYRKTGRCAWLETGELIKNGELSRDDIYEKYQGGEYVVVGIPYRYL